MQSLRSARSKLDSALDEYAQACLTLVNPTGSHPSVNHLQDLASDVGTEVDAFASIKNKTMRIEATLNKARNSLIMLVLINSLPDEVLARIFHLVLKAQSLDFEKRVDEDSLRINSLAISQVCARWRQVSLSCRTLWSHIDLSIRDKLVSLGECLASRSGDHPLSIRVVEPLKRWRSANNHEKFDDFISNIASRMESLEFAWVLPPSRVNISSLWFHILRRCLLRTPKKLIRLVLSIRKELTNYESTAHWFITVTEDESVGETGKTVSLGAISRQAYEDLLFNVQVLWLDVVYPMWTSRAYHGLTELHLIGPPRLTAIITPGELAGILAASPGLRLLHLGVEIRLTETLPSPVHLEELEDLLLQSLAPISQQTILRLILPGRKPLRMSTTYSHALSEFPAGSKDEFLRFFQRSNIVQLQVHSLARILPELLLFRLPNIQTLIFREAFILADVDDTYGSPPHPEFTSIHFISCTMELGVLLWLLSAPNIRDVTVWDCKIDSQIEDLPDHPIELYQHELLSAYPFVRFVDASDYEHTFKVEGWGEDIKQRIANAEKTSYGVQ
ncbi:F-box-like domain protein, partial [Rhizoctonia solani AG-3 Rhs1AP]